MKIQLRSTYTYESNLREEISRTENEVNSTKIRETLPEFPKLIISQFKGTHLDWLRFWSQFEQIDKSRIPTCSKFSFLKEYLNPKSRIIIDGLPFSDEGYKRAKDILTSKYGRPSEVAYAHVQAIIALPTIHQPIVFKIHEFYERLAINVQSLDTMNKLDEIKGYVRLTIDKISCIRADLVRTDEDWQDWDFRNLLEALRKWTDRYIR